MTPRRWKRVGPLEINVVVVVVVVVGGGGGAVYYTHLTLPTSSVV